MIQSHHQQPQHHQHHHQQQPHQTQSQPQQSKLYHNRAVSLNYPLSSMNTMTDRPSLTSSTATWRNHATTPPMLPTMAYGCMLNDGWHSPQDYLSSSSTGSSSSSSSNGSTSATATMTPSPVDMVLLHPVPNEIETMPHGNNIISTTAATSSLSLPTATTTVPSVEIPESLRITGILSAPTAISPKTDDALITYLNRGQLYAIDLKEARPESDGNTMVTTTISITFHEKSHRQVANNYWKFWLSQQRSTDARAISIDDAHCCGVVNIRFSSFDRITFDWDTRQGSRIHVRFHCLSTDFSRIKGVKGIPLRIHLEHRISSASTSSPPPSSSSPIHYQEGIEPSSTWEYVEESFCKIKLFRDKGAERKNKDNSKQYMKHCQKMQENAKDEQQKNLMELMYDLQKPFSVFDVIPQSPSLKHLDDLSACGNEFDELSRGFFPGSGGGMIAHHANMINGHGSMNNKRNRVMTAPSALFHGQQPSSAFGAPFSTTFNTPPHWSSFPSPVVTATATTPGGYFYTDSPTSVYNPSSAVTTPFDGYSTNEHDSKEFMLPSTAPSMSIPPPSPLSSIPVSSPSGCLYNNNNSNIAASNPTLSTLSTMPPPPLLHHNPKKRAREPTSDALPPPSSLHPTLSGGKRIAIRTSDDIEPQMIELQEFTLHELKVKLCTVLSLHPDQVTHIVWRPKDKSSTSSNNSNINNTISTTKSSPSPRKKSNSHSNQDIFITMDDDFITQDLLTWQKPSASWEIKSDGTVRIILEN